MAGRISWATAIAIGWTFAIHAPAIAGECPAPSSSPRVAPGRVISAEDVVAIRDLGGPDGEGFATSPSGTFAAAMMRGIDVAANVSCTDVVVVTVRDGRARVVDDGGDPVIRSVEYRGKVGFPMGPLRISSIQWSPDSTWFAYLKKHDGRVQLWIAGPAMPPRQVSRTQWDIDGFVVESAGRIIIWGQPGLAEMRKAITMESRSGYHFDGRFSPMTAKTPFSPAGVATEYFALDPGSGSLRTASAEERAGVSQARNSTGSARDGAGNRALRVSTDAMKGLWRIGVEGENGGRECLDPRCEGRVSAPWWSEDRRIVYFVRQEGWANRTAAIYAWTPGTGRIQPILASQAVFAACGDARGSAICLREDAATPRQIVRLDYATRKLRVVFDPNPGLTALRTGDAREWRATNDLGFQCFGHLVRPVDYRPGRSYPLVVIGYEDRGYLRGGTGDEYPVQAFAGAGFAVLTYNSPPMLGIARGGKSFSEIERINIDGDAERRSILSCIDQGVKNAVASGIVDKRRIGLTGFSDGVTSAQYALINRDWVAVAALSHGTWEPNYALAVGPSAERDLVDLGYPSFLDPQNAFWMRNSLRRNAARIHAPVLLQVSDAEFSSALEGYTALAAAGKPVDMFVFPDEFHVKWQPAHRLAIYKRAIDWFSYWLVDGWSASPDRAAEVARWAALRHAAAPASPSLPIARTTLRPPGE
ncbi:MULTISPECIES: Atxe2 family lasso peptide isopeptidase [Novosphingobium]|uniref:Atxe2 family lasso peptide isopeptidase n=1 Tax=Novosphingobium TaxID=165696 RepID=UPI0022F2472D|nr:Atxe2 family lasso peptide isopeptidase [Novosphingobium resinovorum]GLK43963.1 acylaminoacyl-peptidase [Novosphingobium resinovorum]